MASDGWKPVFLSPFPSVIPFLIQMYTLFQYYATHNTIYFLVAGCLIEPVLD